MTDSEDLSPKKLHSKEEWARIEAERRKAEDEAWLKRKAQGEVTSKFVVRNQYGIHPDEESLVQARVKHLLAQHHELELMPWRMLEKAWEIGEQLIDLKEMVYPKQWTAFCAEILSSVSLRKIERLMQLRRFKNRLLVKYENDKSVDFGNLPPVYKALEDIHAWSREDRERQGKPPKKSPAKEKRTARLLDTIPEKARVEDWLFEPDEAPEKAASFQPRRCPNCGAILKELEP
jgi:hypothetical protein